MKGFARLGRWSYVVMILPLALVVGWQMEAAGAQLTLSWVDNSEGGAAFSIERGAALDGPFTEVAATALGATAYADDDVDDGATYCYRIRAFNAAGYSDYSNAACGTTAQSFAVAVVKSGPGDGTVISLPTGVICGASCSAAYPIGTAVSLTATPAPGVVFTGWSGACTGRAACDLTMNASYTVTANFDTSATLTVVKAGTGNGKVRGAPAGVRCGRTCTASCPVGTAVTLTATPALGSTFAGWSGGKCSGTGACTVKMSKSKTVTATFTMQWSTQW